nr:glycosyltransferase [Paenibacillus sp. YN15]
MVKVKRTRKGAAPFRRKPAALEIPAGGRPLPIQNADQPKVSVIIPVMNERRSIQAVIRAARSVHPEAEVIVVSNGSTDGTRQLAEAAGARVLFFPEPLGHDVGRSIGAHHAKGEILVFTDGDIVIPGSRLRTFVTAVENGADIALNTYSGAVDQMQVHSVVLAKYALNAVLAKPELKGMSLTAIPHAMSREAAKRIGFEHLAVPPLAQAIAAASGLKLVPACYVEVGSANPKRRRRWKNGRDPLEGLILGDHLEAIGWLLERNGPRGQFPDTPKRRDVIR